LVIVLILLIGYIVYHKINCRHHENFMDMEQYNELMNGINKTNNTANYGYVHPHITSCGY
jgi:hypothetical protein